MSAATKDMVAKTAALGIQTAKQAEESALSIEQAQRHHEQSLMPIVWVRLNCKKLDGVKVPGQPEVQSVIAAEINLVNSGPGPAIAVYLHLRMTAYHPQHALYLGLIGPNTDRTFSTMFDLSSSHQVLEWFPYECVTRYGTIFDTEGAVAQRSHSGKADDAVMLQYFPPSAMSKVEIMDYLLKNGLPTQEVQ